MLDANGINMHHDAITGTSEFLVHWDYRHINGEANSANNPIYADSLGRIIEKDYGFKYSEDWSKYDSIETTSHYYPSEGDLYTILNDTAKLVTVAV